MTPLVYTSICSLDGFMADESGDFSWSQPDEEIHQFINDLEREVGTSLLGRRLYEVMKVWETTEVFEDDSPILLDFARVWQDQDKIVYSRTLDAVSTTRTRLVREFDADDVRELKEQASAPISIGGPTLAQHALRAGIVDEVRLFLVPHVIGAGLAVLPPGFRVQLELQDERRFGNGTVYLRYAVRS
jgi:dihydrofolate reductase